MLLKDRKIIITGGATREWLDPVRFISNPSSGKMGVALADEASARHGETVFIHGHIDESMIKGKGYRCRKGGSTLDMLNAVLDEIENNSVLIMAAAPADYTPFEKSDSKIKKGSEELLIRLKRTPDILKCVNEKIKTGTYENIFVVGFAAETNNVEEYALKKLKGKNLDMICLNDVLRKDAGFATDTNAVTIFCKDGSKQELPLLSKKETAGKIIDSIEERL